MSYMPSHQEFLESVGDFTSFFSSSWTIETKWGVFEWSNPDYYGDGSITYVCKTWDEYKVINNLRPKDFCGRAKGSHIVNRYIGDQYILKFPSHNAEYKA